nr:MAG TPA: hypothetical protein [Caudoviricetes sp.]
MPSCVTDAGMNCTTETSSPGPTRNRPPPWRTSRAGRRQQASGTAPTATHIAKIPAHCAPDSSYTKREKNMEKEPITQMEFDRRMVALREQYAAKLAAARDDMELGQRAKYSLQQQIHELKARYAALCRDLQDAGQKEALIRREEADCRRALHDAFYHQHKPQMYQPFDTSMAYHVRQSVMKALQKALEGKCDTARIQFNYTFGPNGEVEFKTVIPEIEI